MSGTAGSNPNPETIAIVVRDNRARDAVSTDTRVVHGQLNVVVRAGGTGVVLHVDAVEAVFFDAAGGTHSTGSGVNRAININCHLSTAGIDQRHTASTVEAAAHVGKVRDQGRLIARLQVHTGVAEVGKRRVCRCDPDS